MEEVNNLFHKQLKLTKEEETPLIINSAQQDRISEDMSLCLLVKVMTTNRYNKNTFSETMNMVWCISSFT